MTDQFDGVQWPQKLTLEWLKKNEQPVYVRNTTRPRGQLAVNFPKSSGGMKVVKIARTHLPINLSEQLAYDTILNSDDFRACLGKKVVELVRPDHAWQELQDPDAQSAIDELQISAFSAKNAFVSPAVTDMSKTVDASTAPSSPIDVTGLDTELVQARVLRFVEQVKNGDMSVKSAMGELKTMDGELKDTDCSYIIANTDDGQIRSYCQKALAGLQGRQIETSGYGSQEDMPDMTAAEKQAEANRESQARANQQTERPLMRPPEGGG